MHQGYPPTPEQHGRNVARIAVLEAALADLIRYASDLIPDRAPFDMEPPMGRLVIAIDEATHFLGWSRRLDPTTAPELEDEPEPDPDELDGGTA